MLQSRQSSARTAPVEWSWSNRGGRRCPAPRDWGELLVVGRRQLQVCRRQCLRRLGGCVRNRVADGVVSLVGGRGDELRLVRRRVDLGCLGTSTALGCPAAVAEPWLSMSLAMKVSWFRPWSFYFVASPSRWRASSAGIDYPAELQPFRLRPPRLSAGGPERGGRLPGASWLIFLLSSIEKLKLIPVRAR